MYLLMPFTLQRITQTALVKHITGVHVRDLYSTSGPHDIVKGALGPHNLAKSTLGPHDLVKGAPPHVALMLTLTGVTDQSLEGADILLVDFNSLF